MLIFDTFCQLRYFLDNILLEGTRGTNMTKKKNLRLNGILSTIELHFIYRRI